MQHEQLEYDLAHPKLDWVEVEYERLIDKAAWNNDSNTVLELSIGLQQYRDYY